MVFSSHLSLKKRTGQTGTSRFRYLNQLVQEFRNTDSSACKEQVLANLANFAYDPINYPHFRSLRVIELFLSQLSPSTSNNSETLTEFSVAGICNLCLDPLNREILFRLRAIPLLIYCLENPQEKIVLPALTTLYHVIDKEATNVIKDEISERILSLCASDSVSLRNTAFLFAEKLNLNIPSCAK